MTCDACKSSWAWGRLENDVATQAKVELDHFLATGCSGSIRPSLPTVTDAIVNPHYRGNVTMDMLRAEGVPERDLFTAFAQANSLAMLFRLPKDTAFTPRKVNGA